MITKTRSGREKAIKIINDWGEFRKEFDRDPRDTAYGKFLDQIETFIEKMSFFEFPIRNCYIMRIDGGILTVDADDDIFEINLNLGSINELHGVYKDIDEEIKTLIYKKVATKQDRCDIRKLFEAYELTRVPVPEHITVSLSVICDKYESIVNEMDTLTKVRDSIFKKVG
jgi:hypothetical protein